MQKLITSINRFSLNSSGSKIRNFNKINLKNNFSSLFKFQRNFHVEVGGAPHSHDHHHKNVGKFTPVNVVEFPQNLTQEQKKTMKKFEIYRFNPDTGTEEFTSYYLNLKECGPMYLDALIKIKDNIDPTLSFRRSCREGICGSCSMNIDGKNTLACLSYIENDISLVSKCKPLPYFTVIRDLVVDMTHFYSQYKSIQPVLKRKTPKEPGQKEYYQSEEDRKKLDSIINN